MSAYVCIFLLLLSHVSGIQKQKDWNINEYKDDELTKGENPLGCIALHCGLLSAQCVMDRGCLKTLQCMASCSGKPDEAQCQFECEMTVGIDNEPFLALIQCMAEHGCLPELPPDGECLAGPEDTVQEVTSLEMVEETGGWLGESTVARTMCGQEAMIGILVSMRGT